MRILTKGFSLNSDTNDAEWDEGGNFQNHEVVFYNFKDLEQRNHEFAHPYFDESESVEFPSRDEVREFLEAGNDIVIGLPSERIMNFYGPDHDGNQGFWECDVFQWLPVHVPINFDENGDSVRNIHSEWEWYIDENFEWYASFEKPSNLAVYTDEVYTSDPRPSQSKTVTATRPVTNTNPGPGSFLFSLAENNVNKPIAAEVKVQTNIERAREPLQIDRGVFATTGSIYLIPIGNSYKFQKLAEEILERLYDVELEGSELDWVEDYSSPKEEDIRESIENLRSQIKSLLADLEEDREYKKLLWEDGDELEDAVRSAFREIGFTVSGEVPNKRDGAIETSSKTVVLEVMGTESGIPRSKVDKLNRHVEHAEGQDLAENLSCLLIGNPFREDRPSQRSLNTENYEDELEDYDYKFMSSIQVFEMIKQFKSGNLSKEEIESKLNGGETILKFD